MLEPLSPRLTSLLTEMKLCRPRDIRGCRTIVKRLTSDLPTFDSVWIDALVRRKILTPYQANLLESDRPESLAIGDFLVVDRMGGSKRSETLLACLKQKSSSRWALKQLQLRPEQNVLARERLAELCRRSSSIASRQLVLPKSVLAQNELTVVASPYLAGLNLRELMIRRGRFPVRIVSAIARQVLAGLKILETNKLVHGDIRLDNIKLGADGRAALIEVGIRAAITPQLTFVAELSSEHCEALAPELISTGREPDIRSDLYSLGCVLWNLLAGRPTVKDADPLSKLAAHQRRAIGDIREWAPDVPPKLAEAIHRLTRRNPDERPANVDAATALFGRSGMSDRRELRKFQSYFLSQAPAWTVQSRRQSRFPWKPIAACLVLGSGIAVSLFHEGARNELLSLAGRVREQANQFLSEPDATVTAAKPGSTAGLILPVPDAAGVILLDQPGPYQAAEISAVGPITLKAASGVEPIVDCSQPLKITCESLTIDGVHFRNKADEPTSTLVMVRSLDLQIRNSSFDVATLSKHSHGREIAVAWKSIDPLDRSGGNIDFENVCWRGGDVHIYFATPPGRWTVKNNLSLGANTFCRMKEWANPAQPMDVTLEQLSLRDAGSLIRFDVPDSPDKVAGQLMVLSQQCVFDLKQNDSALISFQQAEVSPQLLKRLSFTGSDNLASETILLAGRWNRSGSNAEVIPLAAEVMSIEGILLAPFEYAGSADEVPQGSQVVDLTGPRLGDALPGVDPSKLRFPGSAFETETSE